MVGRRDDRGCTRGAARRLSEPLLRSAAYAEHPALLRLRELEAMTNLAGNAQARIYVGFDKHPYGTAE